MPRRSNLFQDVVAIIHRHVAGDADVEESAMLVHARTGEEREVDVVIRGQVANQPLVISVEATDLGRRASTPWVEAMIAKHEELETNKLILVSRSGFTSPARTLAAERHVVLLSPQDFTGDDPERVVVNHPEVAMAEERLVYAHPSQVDRATT